MLHVEAGLEAVSRTADTNSAIINSIMYDCASSSGLSHCVPLLISDLHMKFNSLWTSPTHTYEW